MSNCPFNSNEERKFCNIWNLSVRLLDQFLQVAEPLEDQLGHLGLDRHDGAALAAGRLDVGIWGWLFVFETGLTLGVDVTTPDKLRNDLVKFAEFGKLVFDRRTGAFVESHLCPTL